MNTDHINSKRTGIRIVSLSILAVLILNFGLKLYRSPVDTYTWTELLINYAAGFIRRGLVGRIGYLISPYISVKFFLSALICICYLIHLILYVRITRNIHIAEWLVFAFSPTAFLFPIYEFDAYGRKDVFLVLIFMVTFWLIMKKVRLRYLIPLVLVLYQIGTLIHEYALFYFPFVVLMILICYRDRPKKELWLTLIFSLVFLLGNLILLYALSKRYYDLDLIPASWEGLIENYDLTPQSGAFGWLGIPLKEGLQPVFDKLSYPQTFFSYLAGMLISAIPMLLLNARYRIVQSVYEIYRERKGLLTVFALLLLSTMAIFIFSSDWGRLTYLYGFNFFLSLVVLKENLNLSEEKADTQPLSANQKIQWIVLFVLFTGTWFLKMYVDGGHIALQQGLIFKILDWISI